MRLTRTLLNILFTVLSGLTPPALALELVAPDGTAVEIVRDSYGVPHISGQTETAVFFGQGFAVAEDRLVQLETYRRTAEGRIAEWLGPAFLPLDEATRQMLYTPLERRAAFDALPYAVRGMFEAYTAGINAYLDSIAADPARYTPLEFARYRMSPWTVESSVAIAQFTTGSFGQFGGFELTRLDELQTYGQNWFNLNRPINDPTAPATIHGPASGEVHGWRHSPMPVRWSVAANLVERRTEWRHLARQVGLPPKFGSFAVLVGPQRSATSNPLLLGAPQMGGPQQGEANTVHELELDCPTLHVGGMALAGLPGVIIGRNEHLSWSLTSGYSDNSDIFVDSTESAGFDRYFHNGTWRAFEAVVDTIRVYNTPELFTHFRTVHGPVVGADLNSRQAYSLKMTFRGDELQMAVSTYAMSQAATLGEFEEALRQNPMSFNVFCATDEGRTGYWHIGRYVDRSDHIDPRLPRRGDGSEEWVGYLPFDELPRATDTEQSYFVNWNNKPAPWWNQGDNMPWLGADHVTAIENYVAPLASMSFAELKRVPEMIGDHGTYQQALEVCAGGWQDESLCPPGQSAFVSLAGTPHPHMTDQWGLHQAWQFKDWIFGSPAAVARPVDAGPGEVLLSEAYPNPFNPRATLRFVLPESKRIKLAVYDVQGRLVKKLADDLYSAGEHRLTFDGDGLASGLYVAKLTGPRFSQSQKLLLLK